MLVVLLSGSAALRPGKNNLSTVIWDSPRAGVQLVYSLGDTMGPALSLGNSVDDNVPVGHDVLVAHRRHGRQGTLRAAGTTKAVTDFCYAH
jgi:hypothetical protein